MPLQENEITEASALDEHETIKEELTIPLPSTDTSLSRRLYPCGFKKEARLILSLWTSLAISNFLSGYLLYFISLIFCGHYGGRLMFSAVAFAGTFVNVTGQSIVYGLSIGCDTLFSQSYGSNRRQISLILQRAILILFYGCLFSWIIMWNSKHLFSFFNQSEPVINQQAEQYVKLMMINLPMIGLQVLFTKYIAAHHVTQPLMWINVLVNVVNVGLHYVFMGVFRWGLRGTAVAIILDNVLLSSCLAILICYAPVFKESWQPISRECLRGWREYLKLTMPGLIIVATEWCSMEIGSLLIARLGENQIAIQGVASSIFILIYFVVASVSQVSTIRTGTLIASQHIDEARNSIHIAYTLGFVGIVIDAVLIICTRQWIPSIYLDKTSSDNIDVIRRSEHILILVALVHFLDGGQVLHMGVLKGVGKQFQASLATFVCYYPVGLTLYFLFMFVFHMDVEGFWTGLAIGQFFLNIVLVIFIQRLDWTREAQLALHRTSAEIIKLPSSPSNLADVELIVPAATEENPSLFRLLRIKIAIALLLVCFLTGNMVFDLTFPKV